MVMTLGIILVLFFRQMKVYPNKHLLVQIQQYKY